MINKKIKTRCPDYEISYGIDRNHISQTAKCKKSEKTITITSPGQLDRAAKNALREKILDGHSKASLKKTLPYSGHVGNLIECPYCKHHITKHALSIESKGHLVTCPHCNKVFQTINMPEFNKGATSLNSACPFCGEKGPDNAVKCRFCGKFKKLAKVTITKIKNDFAKECLIQKLQNISEFQNQKLNPLMNNLPYSFQIDYPTAIDLEITLRNKGVVLAIDDGNIVANKEKQKEKVEDSTPEKEFLSKFKLETLMKSIFEKPLIFKSIIKMLFSQRKDLLIICLIVVIPFLSLGLEKEKQIIFFPVFLGVLWAFIVLSFYGDGDVPLFLLLKGFLFSSTISVFMVFSLGIFANIFNFLPKLLKLFLDVGIIEEVCKITPIFLLFRKVNSKFFTIRYIDVFVISMICGIGFGSCENIFYKVSIDNLIEFSAKYKLPLISELSNTHLLRLISLPFLHACFSGTLGIVLFHGYQQRQLKAHLLWGIFIIGGLHTIYDYFADSKITEIIIVLTIILLGNLTFIICNYIDKMKMRFLKDTFATPR